MFDLKKYNSLFLAILFHLTGVLGILFTPYKDWFVNNTPIILLTMFLLLLKSQTKLSKNFIFFIFAAFLIGMITEIIGVNTGILFGNYQYGNVLGPKLYGVPLLIGFNWFIIVFCAGSFFTRSLAILKLKYNLNFFVKTLIISEIIGGAIIATCFDVILEPVAMKLNFWTWENGQIPMLNYVCWFIVSTILLTLKASIKSTNINKFATNLFIIQILFFLALNLFL